MKKVLSILAAVAMVVSLVACGNQSVESSNQGISEPLDLTGEWIQTNQNAEDQYQVAVITDHTIEVYWVSDGGDTKALYWAGTYVAPETAEDPIRGIRKRFRKTGPRYWHLVMKQNVSLTKVEN